MSRNDEYTTRNLLDCLHHRTYYKLVDVDGIDLSRQTNTTIHKHINFTKNEKNIMVQLCFLSLKSSRK